jgi:PiT family inorganic phosphate transporter
VLHYNDEAEIRLAEIRDLRRAHREHHRSAMERMGELQQMAYTQAMARDAAQAHAMQYETGNPVASPEEFESEYYQGLYRIEQRREEIQSHRALQTYVPLLAALGSMIISAMLLFKGLKNVQLELSEVQNLLIILMVAAAVWMTVFIFARTLRGGSLERSTFLLFSWMQVFTAAGFAFSHGSNDIANAIGPFAAVVDVLHSGDINPEAPVPTIAMLSFGIAMVAGLWFIGKEVITTVGTRLTEIHPASGFAAELSAAAVVLGASTLGIPISSTHVLVGAVLGIGLVNRSADWNLMKPIGMAWLITLPAAASLAAATFVVLRSVF